MKAFVAILVFATCASLASALQENVLTETTSIIVNLVDRNGKAVRDLKNDNFRVRVHGKPATVVSAEFAFAPRRLLVLLDLSGSMGTAEASRKWQISREALETLLKETPGDVPIAMVTFSGQMRDIFDFSQGRTAIANWIRQPWPAVPPWKAPPGTALFDGIDAGLRLLEPFHRGDAIYAITDGGDNRSKTTASLLKTELAASGVRLFGFFLAEKTGEAEVGNKDDFLSLIEHSGGFGFGVTGQPAPWGIPGELQYPHQDELQKRIRADTQELNVLVHGFWTLQLNVPLSQHSRQVQIDVVDSNGKPRKNVGLLYQRMLHQRTKR